MKNNIKYLTAILGIAAAGAFNAQATISDFYGLGSTWSGTPSFETVAAPTFAAAEGNFGGGTANGLGQTFSLTTAGILSQIQIGMAGTGSFGMALYDLGVGPQTPSGGSSFTVGTDLLSSGSARDFVYDDTVYGKSSGELYLFWAGRSYASSKRILHVCAHYGNREHQRKCRSMDSRWQHILYRWSILPGLQWHNCIGCNQWRHS